MLPFWTACTLLGAAVATPAWLVLRWPFRRRPIWIHALGLVVCVPVLLYGVEILVFGILLGGGRRLDTSSTFRTPVEGADFDPKPDAPDHLFVSRTWGPRQCDRPGTWSAVVDLPGNRVM
jgi:hypothetical protein